MRPHEKLDIWKRSVEMVVLVYKMTEVFPKDERFGLTSQIRRAAVSIPANIAEGAARTSDKEFLNFISIAQGSSSELQTELLVSEKLGFLNKNDFDVINKELTEISRMMIGLSKFLKQRNQ